MGEPPGGHLGPEQAPQDLWKPSGHPAPGPLLGWAGSEGGTSQGLLLLKQQRVSCRSDASRPALLLAQAARPWLSWKVDQRPRGGSFWRRGRRGGTEHRSPVTGTLGSVCLLLSRPLPQEERPWHLSGKHSTHRGCPGPARRAPGVQCARGWGWALCFPAAGRLWPWLGRGPQDPSAF